MKHLFCLQSQLILLIDILVLLPLSNKLPWLYSPFIFKSAGNRVKLVERFVLLYFFVFFVIVIFATIHLASRSLNTNVSSRLLRAVLKRSENNIPLEDYLLQLSISLIFKEVCKIFADKFFSIINNIYF